MKRRGVIGLAGVDTRALTRRIREQGMPHARDRPRSRRQVRPRRAARAGPGVGGPRRPRPRQGRLLPAAASPATRACGTGRRATPRPTTPKYEVVVVDYGVKRNILRALDRDRRARHRACRRTRRAEEILARNPDGVLLSNGPGDPAATGEYAVPEIQKLVDSGKPVFGICLGHQMLAWRSGAKTMKMDQGHHGANHPVKDLTTGKVEIVSMNHGFTVDRDSLPEPVKETHVSLFDGTNGGLEVEGRPVFSVQHHPEACPGPRTASTCSSASPG